MKGWGIQYMIARMLQKSGIRVDVMVNPTPDKSVATLIFQIFKYLPDAKAQLCQYITQTEIAKTINNKNLQEKWRIQKPKIKYNRN